ncbi:MAG: Holliday junction resolvase RuvX [Polyangiaceae bacterium]|nr:Holliday junction resolvase RuvX [Polyangiaceae bacterium]
MTDLKGRACGVDYGKVRVGVAVSDELFSMAHPRPALDGTNRKALLAALCTLAETEGITTFVVGYPVEMGGAVGPAAERAERFADALAAASNKTVELLDERMTTVEASRRMSEAGKKKRAQQSSIDSAAAAVLLQAWLDMRGRRK